MRDFYRERRLVWFILVLESVIVFYALHDLYHVPALRFAIETGICLLAVIATRLMNTVFRDHCSDFLQASFTITF